MPFAAGTRLGPYEITGTLGAGGMGEVYRARDTRLGREVAIKILPPELSTNLDRLHRFEQEAHSASALNHPNIVTIHEIGSFDSTYYIAMELVEGKTLRELISGAPILMRKTIQIASQIADGLAKAHAAGIIHRDLKPENLMITKDGFVKILDFGLAKLFVPESKEVSTLPTPARTDAGMILGTVGYMSPEQASGETVDFRSDQFSMGSILYEMVTGQRAFQHKTTVETMAAIINQDPKPIASLNPQVPAPIRWFIERCLAKEPGDRFTSTDDLARDLRSIRDHISEVSSSAEAALDTAQIPQPRKSLQKLWNVAAVLIIAALATALFLSRRDKLSSKENSVLDYHRVTYLPGFISAAKFTPDGQTILYSVALQGNPKGLYMTRTEGVESRALGIPAEDIVSVSSTGGMLVLSPTDVLAQLPLGGGSLRELFTNVTGADWAPDGTRMAIAHRIDGKGTLEFPVGKVIYESEKVIDMINISPKGDLIAFNEHNSGSANGVVVILDLNGKKKANTREFFPFGIAWAPGGDAVWFSSWNLETGRGSMLRSITPTGQERLIQNFPLIVSLFDISTNGSVLLSIDDRRDVTRLKLPDESDEQDYSWLDGAEIYDFSSDGKMLLLHESLEGGDSPSGSMYIRKTDGSAAVFLGGGSPLSFSPDGKWVLANRQQRSILVPIGPGEIKTIPQQLEVEFLTQFFPDGKRFLAYGREKGKPLRFYVIDLAGGQPRPITPEISDTPHDPKTLSPNGKFLFAYSVDHKYFIYPIEGGDPFPLPGILAEELPFQWSADSRSIYVCDPNKRPAQVYKIDVSTGTRTLFKQFLLSDYSGVQRIATVRVAPDESTYAYSYEKNVSTLYLIDGLK